MSRAKRAFITGVNGQDGILLANFLLDKGYEVAGIGSQQQRSVIHSQNLKYSPLDIRDTGNLVGIIEQYMPDELYNLASISSVARSFEEPELTWEVNSRSVSDLLSKLADTSLGTDLRIFQASSSEMFGLATIEPQNENVPFHPVSPYAQSKVSAMEACRAHRNNGLFVSCGIMYNHESIYRPKTFVTRKITSSVAAIKRGKVSKLHIGNMYAERDWGYAGDYIEAMWMMLQSGVPADYVISTGITHSVKDIVSISFDEVGLGGRELEYLELDENLLRPREVNRLVGDSSKIKREIGWAARKPFETLIREMVRHDLSIF